MARLAMKKIDGSTVQAWELADRALVGGRGEDVDIRVADDRASRRHFTVLPKEDGYTIQDMNSTNGTWVNGLRITEAALKANDKIRIGTTILIFEAEKPKGLGTVIGELAKENKGFHTQMGEIVKEAK